MKIILRPHPRGSEVVDVYDGDGDLPWCNVNVDMFMDDRQLRDTLYKNGKSVVVELTWKVLDE